MQKTIVKRATIGAAQYVETPPGAYRLLVALREMGYSSTAAILDVIDNSLDAGATRIDVTIKDVSGGKGNDFVIDIRDDGIGMNEATIREALRLGSEREYNPEDLGRFGVGLVTAGLSIGRSIRVLTRMDKQPAFDAILDLDTIQHHNKFLIELHAAKGTDAMQIERGTLVSLSKVDRIADRNVSRFQESLRGTIGRVYRDYLNRGVKFYVGRFQVKANDPLMLDHELTEIKLDTEITFAPGKTAHLKVVELPDIEGISPRDSGFYLMRNGREIAAAEDFRIGGLYGHHHSYSHFRAELRFTRELDEYFHVNVKKSLIQLDDRMVAKLEAVTAKFIAESARRDRSNAIPVPKVLPSKVHTLAVTMISGTKPAAAPMLAYDEADQGVKKPLFAVSEDEGKQTITYNSSHPLMKLIREEGQSRPGLVLDFVVYALMHAAKIKGGSEFMAVFEASLSEALKK